MWLKFYKLPSKLFLFNTKTCFKQNLESTILLQKLFNNFFPHLGEREGVEIQNWLSALTASLVSSMNIEIGNTFLFDVTT